MKKPKQETLLPDRKGREAPFKRIRELPEKERGDAIQKLRQEMRAHPDTAAKETIESFLAQAHLHADTRAAPELSKLVFLFREIIHDFVPGETIEQALEPLQTLLSRQGGGQVARVDHNAVRRFHARLVANGDHDATSQTAVRFEMTTRNVRKILES